LRALEANFRALEANFRALKAKFRALEANLRALEKPLRARFSPSVIYMHSRPVHTTQKHKIVVVNKYFHLRHSEFTNM